MDSPIKAYPNKPGFTELRYHVAGETHREVYANDRVEAEKTRILSYLKQCQRPLSRHEVESFNAAKILLGEAKEKSSILSIVTKYLDTLREVAPISWSEAILAWERYELDRGLPQKSVDAKINLIAILKDHFDFKNLCEVDRDDMVLLLSRYNNPKTRNNTRATLLGFFDWCEEAGYRVKGSNPARMVPASKVPPKDPVPFDHTSLDALLRVAKKANDTDALYLIVLGAFAGLRQAEILRLTPTDIFNAINGSGRSLPLSSSITKTARRRVVPVSDTLHSWLDWIWEHSAPFRKKTGTLLVRDKNPSRRLRRIAKQAGVVWVSNGLRKGYVSAMTELHTSGAVAKITGHSESVLQTNYKALVTQEEAEAWFDILPGDR